MAQPSSISVVLDDLTLADVRKAIGVLETKLKPLLKSLAPEDRKELPRLGDKTLAFVTKSWDHAQRHPDLVPSFLNVPAFGTDLDAYNRLRGLERDLEPLMAALSDSVALSGSEAYQAALVFYTNVKAAKKLNVGASVLVYDDLAARFPGRTGAGT